MLAILIENRQNDGRETIRKLCLLTHSADKIGVQIESVFAEVKEFGTPETVKVFDNYFRSGCRDIEAMGYAEIVDEDGFRYETLVGTRAARRRVAEYRDR